jgi:hypothetical protein
LAALFSIVLLGMAAFVVDLGYVINSQQELQRTADSAALAACWNFGASLASGESASAAMSQGRGAAQAYASKNCVANDPVDLALNVANAAQGDVVFGEVVQLTNPDAPFVTDCPELANAVRVRVRRDEALNGELPYFFAKVFGLSGQSVEAEATAAYVRRVAGFRLPPGGGNLQLLPFALDVGTWNALLAGSGADNYAWDEASGSVVAGCDDVLEVNLFPQGTGSPGNRGTVDIGGSNNSTSDIARQILHGVSAEDLAVFGGELKFDENGELTLNGDTGISAGVKDELASICGQVRAIPLFASVQGPGNNAQYKIVHWAGVRVMAVKLTGSMKGKHVTIQPAPLVMEGVVPGEDETSDYVYSPVVLIK